MRIIIRIVRNIDPRLRKSIVFICSLIVIHLQLLEDRLLRISNIGLKVLETRVREKVEKHASSSFLGFKFLQKRVMDFS